jgi:hypothetical protein
MLLKHEKYFLFFYEFVYGGRDGEETYENNEKQIVNI